MGDLFFFVCDSMPNEVPLKNFIRVKQAIK